MHCIKFSDIPKAHDTNNNRKPSGGAPKFNLNWFYALILVILGILYITNQDGGVKKSITYTEFQTYVEKGYVNKIVAYNDNSLDVYIKPEFAPEVLKTDAANIGRSPMVNTRIGSTQSLEEFLKETKTANPELKKGKLKRGTFLFIPYGKNDRKEQSTENVTKELTNEEIFNQYESTQKNINTIKAAVMIPFMTGQTTNKDDQIRMVEFYEGFLMAVDSLKKQGVSIDLYAYDTKGSSATTNNILAKKEMKDMDIIFGPAKTQNIDELAAFADKNNIRLVIPFTPKVDEVFNNPHIYQVNTPQSYLYSEVYEHFTRKFTDSNVIFLNAGNGDIEKDEFVKGMKTELKNKGIKYRDFIVTDNFYEITTVMDTLKNNVFIPTSGKSTALVKILPQLTQIRRERPNYQINLFGYPEWQTYTNDYLASFYEIGTYFYSSFYTNNLFPAAINFTHSYRRWYSKDMANIYPKYGMLGYDIAYFFLKGLSKYGNKLEENLSSIHVTPIQTGFKFERVNNWGGFINRKVFFVHFSKDYELIKLDFE